MLKKEKYDVVIVGGGQAGISLSYYLKKKRLQHLLLEQDLPFSSWRKRWDSFRANTPNWMNTLPFMDAERFPGNDPQGFATRDEIVAYLDECLKVASPPMRTGTTVRKIEGLAENRWQISTDDTIYEAANVAVCIGAMRTPKLPAGAGCIPSDVPQIHSSNYQNLEQLSTKAVLIVGSGSSGVQICRNVCVSRRVPEIYLSVSNVLVLPDSIFRIPIHRFLHFFGLFGIKKESLLGKVMYRTLEDRGDPILRPAPKDLAKLWGVHLFGKFSHVKDRMLYFIDGKALAMDDLTIIWCTGFKKDFSLIEVNRGESPFDLAGAPKHNRGVVPHLPGLYFVGLRYQYTVASHDLFGVGQDAMYVADHIHKRKI